MEEIKVGEYVRTKKQGICKIDHINEKAPVNKYWVNPDYDGWCTCLKTTAIVKHSFNIIDLIEVGDTVNKKIVVEKNENGDLLLSDGYWYYEHDIKTIITKEQMKSIEYEV